MLRVTSQKDTERACIFGAQVFCSDEPMCKAIGVTVPEFVQQFTPMLKACCTSGLSYVLEDVEGGNILAMSVALPYDQYNAIQLDDNPKLRPVMAMLDAVAEEPPASGETAALNFMWATHSAHMNKGYAKKVVMATMAAARQAGFTCLIADLTNSISQHISTLFGYQPSSTKVSYHDFDCFKGIQGTEFVIRAVKPLLADVDQQDQQPSSSNMSSSWQYSRSNSSGSCQQQQE